MNTHEENDDFLDHRILEKQTAALPRDIEPPRDLWPGIEQRLAERRPQRVGTVRARAWRPVLLRAVAALFFMALGGVVSRVAWPAPPETLAPDAPAAVADMAPAGGYRLTSDAAIASLEEGYLRAKDDLWLVVLERRDEISPTTMKVLTANLRIIDRALKDIRFALEEDPNDRQMRDLLLSTRDQELKLLRRLATSV